MFSVLFAYCILFLDAHKSLILILVMHCKCKRVLCNLVLMTKIFNSVD